MRAGACQPMQRANKPAFLHVQVAAAAFAFDEGRDPAEPELEPPAAAVVRARVVAAKCVEQTIAAAKAELAQLAAQAQTRADAAQCRAEEAETERLKIAGAGTEAAQQQCASLRSDGAVSVEGDSDGPHVPPSTGESSQVGLR